MILLAAFSRLIPHMPNFSPLGALGLFGAAHFSKKYLAFLIPILATWLSDLYINNVVYGEYYPEFVWFYRGFYWQYGSYLLITAAGLWIFRDRIRPAKVVSGALASGIIFFLVSNFGVWLGSKLYPQTLEGLMTCYVAGIPFYKGTLFGDLFYTGVLFGAFYALQKWVPVFRMSHLKYS